MGIGEGHFDAHTRARRAPHRRRPYEWNLGQATRKQLRIKYGTRRDTQRVASRQRRTVAEMINAVEIAKITSTTPSEAMRAVQQAVACGSFERCRRG